MGSTWEGTPNPASHRSPQRLQHTAGDPWGRGGRTQCAGVSPATVQAPLVEMQRARGEREEVGGDDMAARMEAVDLGAPPSSPAPASRLRRTGQIRHRGRRIRVGHPGSAGCHLPPPQLRGSRERREGRGRRRHRLAGEVPIFFPSPCSGDDDGEGASGGWRRWWSGVRPSRLRLGDDAGAFSYQY
jgi:hypothetical protein